MKNSIRLASFSVLMALVLPSAFAESAPVYDADALPPFDQGAEQEQQADVPPPSPSPAPETRSSGQESGGFVPMQSDAVEEENAALAPKRATTAPVPTQSSTTAPTTERLKRLEQQVANLQSTEKTNKLDSLQSQNQALRSELEQLNHQVQQLQKQLKAQPGDASVSADSTESVAKRPAEESNKESAKKSQATSKPAKSVKAQPTSTANKEKTTDSSAAPAESTDENAQPNVQEEQQIYQTAYTLIKSKKYTEAIDSLKGMLKKYPSGQFASNAHYWLGELYGLSGKNDQALTEFSTVVKDHPESPRVAEAQLKVGLIYATQSKWTDAKSALKKVVTHYPGTTSAKLASEQLKQIKQAGH